MLGEAGHLGLPQQLRQPDTALTKAGLLAGQIGVKFAEDLDQIPASIAGQRVTHFVQAQAQLREAPNPGQLNGVPQRVLTVAVGLARGLGQQPHMVVVPDGPGTDADKVSEFSDPHATRKHLNATTRSNAADAVRPRYRALFRNGFTRAYISACLPSPGLRRSISKSVVALIRSLSLP